MVVGEARTFQGPEGLLRDEGVVVEVVDDPGCVELMATFTAEHPELWNEDIGE